jgi:nucleosome binding factor SPN SPT16 subunit
LFSFSTLQIMHEVASDVEGFFRNGGWSFLSGGGGEGDGDGSEEMSDSESEFEPESEDDDSDEYKSSR